MELYAHRHSFNWFMFRKFLTTAHTHALNGCCNILMRWGQSVFVFSIVEMHSIKLVKRAFSSASVWIWRWRNCVDTIPKPGSMPNEQIHPELISMLVCFMTRIHHHWANENIFPTKLSISFCCTLLRLVLNFALMIERTHALARFLCLNKKSFTLYCVCKHKSRGPTNTLFIYICISISVCLLASSISFVHAASISFRFLFPPHLFMFIGWNEG